LGGIENEKQIARWRWHCAQTTIPRMTPDHVMSRPARRREALASLDSAFEKLTGHHVNMTYAVSSLMQQKLAAANTRHV